MADNEKKDVPIKEQADGSVLAKIETPEEFDDEEVDDEYTLDEFTRFENRNE